MPLDQEDPAVAHLFALEDPWVAGLLGHLVYMPGGRGGRGGRSQGDAHADPLPLAPTPPDRLVWAAAGLGERGPYGPEVLRLARRLIRTGVVARRRPPR